MPAMPKIPIQEEEKGVVVRLARFFSREDIDSSQGTRVITPIPNLSNYPSIPKGTANPGWKIGEIMPGKIVSNGKGNSIVNIAGNNYWLNSPLNFKQGESLMLRVAGLSPMIHFSLVNRVRENVGNTEALNMSAQEKVLQNLAASDRNLNSSVTNLISLLHFGSTQTLPPATLQLLDAMRRRLLKSSGLGNPSLIRHSVLNGSIVNGGSTALSSAAAGDNGLQSLLHQLVDSLTLQRNGAGALPALANYRAALGVAQYLSNDGDLLRSFTRSAEEQYLNLTTSKSKSQEEMPFPPYRLFVELPVVFKDHISSISIRFAHGGRKSTEESSEEACSVEFELDLPACGRIYTSISILKASVTYYIGCERERVAFHLSHRDAAVAESLVAYGLRLGEYRCEVREGHLAPDAGPHTEGDADAAKPAMPHVEDSDIAAIDESLRKRLHEAHDRGHMPELKEFNLQIDQQPVVLETEIPVELYCAMAAFFVQLLEIENA